VLDRDEDDDTVRALPAAARGIGHELRNLGQVLLAAVDELETAGDPAARDAALRELVPELARVSRALDAHGLRLLRLGRRGS
jgi:hypothetical protein